MWETGKICTCERLEEMLLHHTGFSLNCFIGKGKYKSFQEALSARGKQFLLDLVFHLILRLAGPDIYSNIRLPESWKWLLHMEFDHMKHLWIKIKGVGAFRDKGDMEGMMLEMMKTQPTNSGIHDRRKLSLKEYEEVVARKNTLNLSPFGGVVRPGKSSHLNLKLNRQNDVILTREFPCQLKKLSD